MPACWRCDAAVDATSHFCPACEVLQPPRPGRSHFEALGVAETYRQDPAELDRRFKALSRQLHPDRFAMEEAPVRRLAMEHATALNDAIRTLRDPDRRARYLLERWGRPLSEKSGRNVALPFEFLEEIMELREAITGARRAGDEATLASLLAQVRAQSAALEAQLSARFDAHDAAPPTERGALETEVEQLVHRQRYLMSILGEDARSA